MQSLGYEIARRAVPSNVCQSLRGFILTEVERHNSPWRRLAAAVSLTNAPPIREPRHRVHLPLAVTADVNAALVSGLAALGGRACVERAGLSVRAELVELSVMLSLPGAKAQKAHSDISPLAQRPMCTLWCALQDVSASMGPLTIFPASPTEMAGKHDWAAVLGQAERRRAVEDFGSTFSPDGERCEVPHTPPELADVDAVDPDPLLGESLAVEMGVGDVLLLDCRTFHLGGANESTKWRAQLSATFRDARGDAHVDGPSQGATQSDQHDEGFSYQLRPELVGRYCLGDFLAQMPEEGAASTPLQSMAHATAAARGGGGSGSRKDDDSEAWLWASILAVLGGMVALGPAAEIAERESPSEAAAHSHATSAPPWMVTERDYAALLRNGYVVVDGVLSDRLLRAAARDAAGRAFEPTQQHSAAVRTDRVVWIREDDHSVKERRDAAGQDGEGEQLAPGAGLCGALRCLRAIPLLLETHRSHRSALDDEAPHAALATARLGVPRSAQLASYPSPTPNDDEEVARGGGARYRAHRDTSVVPWYKPLNLAQSAGVNCREVTAILYLGDPDAWAAREAASSDGTTRGGELLLYLGAAADDETGASASRTVSVQPVSGRLVLFDSRSILHEVTPHRCESPRVALTLWIGGRHSGFGFGWLRKWGLTQ